MLNKIKSRSSSGNRKFFKIILFVIIALLYGSAMAQNPTYILNLTNDQQVSATVFEFDIFLLRTGATAFEYANNSQYFVNINPAIINGGTLTFTILPGTCELNLVQQILGSKVSFDAVNFRLRIAAHSPSGAGTGTIIANTGLGTRLGRFRVTNTVSFAAAQTNLTWYNGPAGFFVKIFAYVSDLNVEITNFANHLININNNSLPVELAEFRSTVSVNNVSLLWTTTHEINNSGFEIERNLKISGRDVSNWERVGFVKGIGTTNEPASYSYEDKKLKTGKYSYRLKQIDYNSNFEYFALQGDVSVGRPGEFSMGQNYPNPSNPKCKIDYEIPVTANVNIKVYDMLGREVITLVNETKEAGYYSAEFDGSNLASGVYFYKLVTGDPSAGYGQSFVQIKKMVLVK